MHQGRREPLAEPESEAAAVRSAIERPHVGDPSFAKAFEPLQKPRWRQMQFFSADECAAICVTSPLVLCSSPC